MIEFSGVSKSFGAAQVLDGLTFVARDNAVTGFVGPNGAGKSTAFKILVGLLDADEGQTSIDGVEYRQHDDPGSALGAFLGSHWIPNGMTGRSYLRNTADLLGASRRSTDEILSVVGLEQAATQKVGSYSLGMRQRLGIAAALVGEPANLVLDEPVNGLDIDGVRWLRQSLRAAADAGRCVLLSSHLLSELELVADDVVMLGGGRASRTGTVEALRTSSTASVVVRSENDERVAQRLRELGAIVELHDGALHVVDRTVNWVAAAAASTDVLLHSVARHVSRLEDVYLEQVRIDEQGARR